VSLVVAHQRPHPNGADPVRFPAYTGLDVPEAN
jgi:hypothetical protein